MWQRKSRVYGRIHKMKNFVAEQFKAEDLTEAEELERLSDILGGFKGMVDEVIENPSEFARLDDIELVRDNSQPFE